MEPAEWMALAAVVSAAATVATSVVSMRAEVKASETEQQAYNYNAAVLEQDAQATETKYAYEENIQREKIRRLLGTQRALYAKSGVDITSGSPLIVLADTAEQGEADALMIRYTGNVEAAELRNKASLQRFYGANAKIAGQTGSATTLLSGLAKTGTSVYGIAKNWPASSTPGSVDVSGVSDYSGMSAISGA